MGRIKSVLARARLPERQRHNSRLFVDLAEQVHIHFREFRNVFSVDEFFEYADTVARSAKDLRRFLRWHPEYREMEVFDPILIALGKGQQTRPLHKSPKPDESAYFPNRLQIELQGEEVVDEIHIHYRDYRLAMDRRTFRVFAEAVGEAASELDAFLGDNAYERIEHPVHAALAHPDWHKPSHWPRPRPTRIGLRARARAILYYLGGDRLVEWARGIASRFRPRA